MYTIRAPHDAVETVIVMPNPEMGDAQAPQSQVLTKRTLDGKLATYIRKQESARIYRWDFDITRKKALEWLEFIRNHIGDTWQVDDGTTSIVGYLTTNPAELDMVARAVVAGSKERVSLSIEFESIQ